MTKAEAIQFAKSILEGKPTSYGYVNAAMVLSRFILDHQLMMAGWFCKCGLFNGEEKEKLIVCRNCGGKR